MCLLPDMNLAILTWEGTRRFLPSKKMFISWTGEMEMQETWVLIKFIKTALFQVSIWEVLASKLSKGTNYNTTFRGCRQTLQTMSEEYIS